MRDTTPSYNLKVAVRETGIKPDTLRAWERRYNLPQPQRTEGGHRLYSQRDLDTVKWLLARQEEGLRISHAVRLWRDTVAAGNDPLRQTPSMATSSDTASAADHLAELRKAWLRACMDFDEATAEQQLGLALARHAPEQVCVELLQKGLAEIGRLWYQHEATVPQEHFATAVAQRHINALLADAPSPSRSQPVLLACPPQEEHAFPLLLLALLLRHRGWPVVYLGANVPLAEMDGALRASNPTLVILAAQTLPTAAETLAMARLLHEQETPLAYGGQVFNRLPQLRQRLPGYFLGEGLVEAASNVPKIVAGRPVMPTGEPFEASYRQELAAFDRLRPLIDDHVWQSLETNGLSKTEIQAANSHMARNIRAALALGDLSLLSAEIDWVSQLLTNYGFAPQHLTRFLDAYKQAAEDCLDERCEELLAWLRRIGD